MPSEPKSNQSSFELPPHWLGHTQLLLDSYARWLGTELIEREGTQADQLERLFSAKFIVVSHGTQADPILNYANQRALKLWEMDISTLRKTPSRLTAEPVHRAERATLLKRTTNHGYVDDYRGVRISQSGKRFLIEKATVWNLVDPAGKFAGQAATFSNWTWVGGKDITD